jgi:pyrroloquinoline quinone biosynthesis protein D
VNDVPRPPARVVIGEASVPRLPKHARLQLDKARGVWVILVPERVLVPDETAIEIVKMCDGVISVAGIVEALAKKYAADRALIQTDVIAMLQDLADKGYLLDGRGAKS